MAKTVDSYHFTDGVMKRLVKSWIRIESPRPIPWTPPSKPVSDCTAVLITSGCLPVKSDRPFDQESERENPRGGDPHYRVIPRMASTGAIRVYHQHIEASFAERDINCLLPTHRLQEMVEVGEVRPATPSHARQKRLTHGHSSTVPEAPIADVLLYYEVERPKSPSQGGIAC